MADVLSGHATGPAPALAADGGAASGAGRTIPDVVPLKGLPVVALVLAGLVVSIAGNWRWALNWYHVAGGGLWTGVDLFVGLVLGPIIGRLSPPARAEFAARFMPKMVLIMPTLVTMTLASGWQVARQMGNLQMAYPQRWWITASMIVVAIMSVVALGILEPANLAVLFEMRKRSPDTALIGRLMRRFVYCAGITGAMQIAILVIMTRIASW